MTVMEFILVAHAILTGLGIAEVLRGFADLIRAVPVTTSRRLIGIAAWTLLLFFQLWWAVWRVGERDTWSFTDFLVMLLPVVILYLLARISFPKEIDGADLKQYYKRVAPALWFLVAGVYISFAVFQPILYGAIQPVLLASQVVIAVAALVATKFDSKIFQFTLLALMIVQVAWRGLIMTVGT
ncbi:MAG: hypothetical protein WBN23_16160 [Woeseia sp.]